MSERPRLNLKERQHVVQSLWHAVNDGGDWLNKLPDILRTLLDTRAWEKREVDGKIVSHQRFVDFITTPPRAGCGWNPAQVERLIVDDADTLRRFRQAITPLKHQHSDSNNVTIRRGNSRAYTLDRLQREAPTLYARVIAGELSAHAAAKRAGFVKSRTPLEQLQYWWRKANPAEREAFKATTLTT